jgi:geranylgeranyl pyrophosphate synthase
VSEPARLIGPSQSVELPAEVLADLVRVEERLRAELVSREPRLEGIAVHLVGAGGKRIRPLVVLLAYHAAARSGHVRRRDDAVEVAVALELIHSATLLHDDILDSNHVRRGKPSALEAFGLADTLVAGDYLFCRAFALCARFEAEVIRWAAEACVALTEGEILQARFRRNSSVTLDDYLEIIDRKTAVLFATGARTAARLAGVPENVVAAMEACGRHLGLAFQMQDDLLDVAGSVSDTGKPQGLDLQDGNPSMPLVLALPHDEHLRALFANPAPRPGEIAEGLQRLRASGVLPQVADAVHRETARGRACLDALPPSAARDALLALVEQLDQRAS